MHEAATDPRLRRAIQEAARHVALYRGRWATGDADDGLGIFGDGGGTGGGPDDLTATAGDDHAHGDGDPDDGHLDDDGRLDDDARGHDALDDGHDLALDEEHAWDDPLDDVSRYDDASTDDLFESPDDTDTDVSDLEL